MTAGLVFIFLLYLGYALLMLTLAITWRRAKSWNVTQPIHENMGLSVLIPVRDEEDAILRCLASIANQDFPVSQFEVIVIDDHSSDRSFQFIQEFIAKTTIAVHCFRLPTMQQGKKLAIAAGVKKARFSRIVTTDADCVMNPSWLRTIASFWQHTQANLIVGPVTYHQCQNAFEKLQLADFTAMVSFGAATCLMGKSTICNGANLAFTAAVFREVSGYDGNTKIPSGDDVFLLHKLKHLQTPKIHFVNHPDALVYTIPCSDFKTFVAQRIRWATKGKHYRDSFTVITSVLILAVNFLLLISSGLAIGYPQNFLGLPFLLFGIKLAVDFYFMFPFFRFLNVRKEMHYFLLLPFIYPVYLLLITIFTPFYTFSWKGRTQRQFLEQSGS
jgi:biofilm PGA synthesis N-glycosyltransferase PgaC